MEPELRDWLALGLVPGLGPRLTANLIEHFGSAGAVLRAGAGELERVPKIGPTLAGQFAAALRAVDPQAEFDRMRQFGVRAVRRGSPEYPALLGTIYDPPSLLYVRGGFTEQDRNGVAVVGSRSCTRYGRKVTARLASDLVRAGFTVVSGLARGIDGEAHRAALTAGGRTLAVLAGGLSRIYPPEHTELAAEVAASGCVLTETPMTVQPQPGMFHARNRLISGLCRAVVVVEAGERSGTLITASHAAEQGRDVFAVPGNVDSPASAGTLELIRKGARPIRGIDDLLEDLGASAPLLEPNRPPDGTVPEEPVATGPPPGLDDTQRRVWEFLDEPRFVDVIVTTLKIPVGELARVLMGLEVRRLVRRLPGNQYERA